MFTREQRRVATLLEGTHDILKIRCRPTTHKELQLRMKVLLVDERQVMLWRGWISTISRLDATVTITTPAGPEFVRLFSEVAHCVWIEVDQDGYDVT